MGMMGIGETEGMWDDTVEPGTSPVYTTRIFGPGDPELIVTEEWPSISWKPAPFAYADKWRTVRPPRGFDYRQGKLIPHGGPDIRFPVATPRIAEILDEYYGANLEYIATVEERDGRVAVTVRSNFAEEVAYLLGHYQNVDVAAGIVH